MNTLLVAPSVNPVSAAARSCKTPILVPPLLGGRGKASSYFGDEGAINFSHGGTDQLFHKFVTACLPHNFGGDSGDTNCFLLLNLTQRELQ